MLMKFAFAKNKIAKANFIFAKAKKPIGNRKSSVYYSIIQ